MLTVDAHQEAPAMQMYLTQTVEIQTVEPAEPGPLTTGPIMKSLMRIHLVASAEARTEPDVAIL